MWRPIYCLTSPVRARGRPASRPTPSTPFSTRAWGFVGGKKLKKQSWGLEFQLSTCCCCLVSPVCDQPLSAGAADAAGVRVAPRPIRIQQLSGRGGALLWLVGVRFPDRGVVRSAASGKSQNQPCYILFIHHVPYSLFLCVKVDGSTDSTMHYKGELTVVLKYIPAEINTTPPPDQVQGNSNCDVIESCLWKNSLISVHISLGNEAFVDCSQHSRSLSWRVTCQWAADCKKKKR